MAKKIDIEVAAKYIGREAMKSAAADIDAVDKGSKKSTSSLKQFAGTAAAQAAIVGVAFGAVAVATKAAWDELGRGAALNKTADQFDRLSASIGTTADSLLGKMRDATHGLISDANLMASGTDIMSLGLAKTEENVVRLASVVGELGWDMGTVILTMANNSKMRLDSLGLSVEDVDKKTQALVATGMSLDDAFDMAVLQAGEEKIKLMGPIAETTAGQMKKLTTQVENARDAFSKTFAEGLADDIKLAGDNAEALGDGLMYAAEGAAAFVASLGGGVIRAFILAGQKAEVKSLIDEYVALGGAAEDILDPLSNVALTMDMAGGGDIAEYTKAIKEMTPAVAAAQDQFDHANPELKFLDMAPVKNAVAVVQSASKAIAAGAEAGGRAITDSMIDAKGALDGVVKGYVGVAAAVKEYQDAVSSVGAVAKQGLADQQAAAAAVKQAYTEAAVVMSSAFSAALQDDAMPDFGNADAMKESAFAMAQAFGLTTPILADIGVQLGVIDSQTAEAAVKAGLFAGAMQTLMGQLASGMIDPAQFTTAVDELITNLNNHSAIELQVDLKVTQKAIDDIDNMDWLPDAAKEGMKKNLGLEITVADEALKTALATIDGIPDNDEKIITFTPEDQAVLDSIDAISLAIPAIPGTVTFVPETEMVDNEITRLNGTRITVYVDYVNAGGAAGGSHPINTSTNRSTPGSKTRSGGKSGVAALDELYTEIQREGVAW